MERYKSLVDVNGQCTSMIPALSPCLEFDQLFAQLYDKKAIKQSEFEFKSLGRYIKFDTNFAGMPCFMLADNFSKVTTVTIITGKHDIIQFVADRKQYDTQYDNVVKRLLNMQYDKTIFLK